MMTAVFAQYGVLTAMCILFLSVFMVIRLLIAKGAKKLLLQWCASAGAMAAVIAIYFSPVSVSWTEPLEETTIEVCKINPYPQTVPFNISSTADKERLLALISSQTFHRNFFNSTNSSVTLDPALAPYDISLRREGAALNLLVLDYQSAQTTDLVETDTGLQAKNPADLIAYLESLWETYS